MLNAINFGKPKVILSWTGVFIVTAIVFGVAGEYITQQFSPAIFGTTGEWVSGIVGFGAILAIHAEFKQEADNRRNEEVYKWDKAVDDFSMSNRYSNIYDREEPFNEICRLSRSANLRKLKVQRTQLRSGNNWLPPKQSKRLDDQGYKHLSDQDFGYRFKNLDPEKIDDWLRKVFEKTSLKFSTANAEKFDELTEEITIFLSKKPLLDKLLDSKLIGDFEKQEAFKKDYCGTENFDKYIELGQSIKTSEEEINQFVNFNPNSGFDEEKQKKIELQMLEQNKLKIAIANSILHKLADPIN